MCGSGGPPPPPPEKSQKYRFFEQYWSGSPEKSKKLPSQHSMLGHHWHASETPFKWRFAGGPMMTLFYWYLDSITTKKHH